MLLLVRQKLSRDQEDFIYTCEIFFLEDEAFSVLHPKSILTKTSKKLSVAPFLISKLIFITKIDYKIKFGKRNR